MYHVVPSSRRRHAKKENRKGYLFMEWQLYLGPNHSTGIDIVHKDLKMDFFEENVNFFSSSDLK